MGYMSVKKKVCIIITRIRLCLRGGGGGWMSMSVRGGDEGIWAKRCVKMSHHVFFCIGTKADWKETLVSAVNNNHTSLCLKGTTFSRAFGLSNIHRSLLDICYWNYIFSRSIFFRHTNIYRWMNRTLLVREREREERGTRYNKAV